MRRLKAALCIMLTLTLLCCTGASAVSLKKGQRGFEPYVLNLRLNALGYDTDMGGFQFDDAAVKAVKSFQEQNGMKATGTVDDATWEALFNESYTLSISPDGIGHRDYQARGKLVVPFASVETENYSTGKKAVLKMIDMECYVTLKTSESIDAYIQSVKESSRKNFDDLFAAEYNGKDFRIKEDQDCLINGKNAHICCVAWDFFNENALTRYDFYGIVELDEFEGKQMYASATMKYNFSENNDALLEYVGVNTINEVLKAIRCDRDRLAEYKAGEAKRKKASKLDVKLPEFQPVDETEQTLLEMVYTIRDNVDPAADGSSGKLNGKTCVSMYYGTKIMQRYILSLEGSADSRSACASMELLLSLGIFDEEFNKTEPRIRAALSAALKAAKLALKKESEPYLVLMGLEKPRWTAEDADKVYESLIGLLDVSIAQRLPSITSVSFEVQQAEVDEEVRIIAETSRDTESLCMYAGDKLVRTWTDGYTDSRQTRTWDVTHAFSGKGNRTITFKAQNYAGMSEGMDARIIIVPAVIAVPVVKKVEFNTDSAEVKEDVGITAVTSRDTEKLCMYAGDKLVKTWTDGYTANQSEKIWELSHAFSGTGNRTITFRAENSAGTSEGMDVPITITAHIPTPPILHDVSFGAGSVEAKKTVEIFAMTSTDAKQLHMYAGDKLVRTWTDGYMDDDSIRYWTLTTTFSGTGDRRITFRAENDDGFSEGADAYITVTEPVIPKLYSVNFGADSAAVKKEVTIIAVTSTDTEELNMYTGKKLVRTWNEGYTDNGGIRTWKVAYTFKNAGERKLTFTAGSASGMSEGVDVTITVK